MFMPANVHAGVTVVTRACTPLPSRRMNMLIILNDARVHARRCDGGRQSNVPVEKMSAFYSYMVFSHSVVTAGVHAGADVTPAVTPAGVTAFLSAVS